MMSRRTFVAGSSAVLLPLGGVLAQTRLPRYTGELLLRPLADGRMMKLEKPFGYVDAADRAWNVPAGAVVDGASIPRVFWPIVGGPWEGAYREASVVHDWFCAVRTRSWKQTHHMFYDAMLTSRVGPKLARLMYLAVRYGGPSWDDLTIANSLILSRNGTVRLDPPGKRPNTNGFSSAEEAESSRTALIAEFQNLADQASERKLSAAEMDALVDAHGREEDVAAMLST